MFGMPLNLSASSRSGDAGNGAEYGMGAGWTVNVGSGSATGGGGLSPLMMLGIGLALWFLLKK